MDKKEKYILRVQYQYKLAKFEKEVEEVQKIEKSKKKPPYSLSIQLWLLAYDLKISVPDKVQEVFVEALRAKVKNEKHSKQNKPNRITQGHIDNDAKNKKYFKLDRKEEDDMYEFITKQYLDTEAANKQNSDLSTPKWTDAFRAYRRKMKQYGKEVCSVSALKVRYERIKQKKEKNDEDLMKAMERQIEPNPIED